MNGVQQTLEYRESQAFETRLRWKRPEYRASVISGLKLYWDDPLRLALWRQRMWRCEHEQSESNLIYHSIHGRIACRECYNARRRLRRRLGELK
jgi:hypothetical protein